MITYQIEDWKQYYKDCQSLWTKDCEELGNARALNPDVEVYESLEKLKMLSIITARHNGKLIAYKVFIIRGNLHHKDILTAFEDCCFIDPCYRFGKIAIKLLSISEEILNKLNVKEIFCTVNTAGGTGRLMEKYGFELNSLIYSKRI